MDGMRQRAVDGCSYRSGKCFFGFCIDASTRLASYFVHEKNYSEFASEDAEKTTQSHGLHLEASRFIQIWIQEMTDNLCEEPGTNKIWHLQKHDVVSWAAMIAGYVQHGCSL